MNYRYRPNLIAEVTVPDDGILSRPLHNDEQVRVVLFGFSQGQELSEHTASMPAILHVLQGEARIGLGGDTYDATAGSWAYMPPNLPHSVVAKTPLILLLTLIKNGSDEDDEE
jgi:quercetin dioxygenase-like cupin family protein